MKINNKKVIISTLALAMGAALAGSVSGSVAWYQYSTRVTSQLSGTSAGTSRNLHIATGNAAPALGDGAWGWDVDLDHHDLKPVSAVIADGVPTYYGQAVRQYWAIHAANGDEYLHFDLYFENINEQGARVAADVYLETLTVTYAGSKKLDDGLRMIISDGDSHKNIVSKTAGTTVTHGQLDLNGDGVNDRTHFYADDRHGLINDGGTWKVLISKKAVASSEDPNDLVAGSSADGWYTNEACSAAAESIVAGTTYYKKGDAPTDYGEYYAGTNSSQYTTTAWSGLVATVTDEYTISGTPVCSIPDAGTAHLSVDIWLEGFASINDKQVWDNTLLGEDFSIQMRFQTPAIH